MVTFSRYGVASTSPRECEKAESSPPVPSHSPIKPASGPHSLITLSLVRRIERTSSHLQRPCRDVRSRRHRSRRGPMDVRRVVTGHDGDGKAVFVSDTTVAPVTLALLPGSEFHQLWGADEPPRFPD